MLTGRRLSRLGLALLGVLAFTPVETAWSQQVRDTGGIRVIPAEDLRKVYLVPDQTQGFDDPAPRPGDVLKAREFALEVAYNLKLRHLAGANASPVECRGQSQPVSAVVVDGVHIRETGLEATVYYTAGFGGGGPCPAARLELQIVRLADGDWYAPDWGVRLVRRR